jgi:hypothetical protein
MYTLNNSSSSNKDPEEMLKIARAEGKNTS